jgi:hypothetical protein
MFSLLHGQFPLELLAGTTFILVGLLILAFAP